MTTQPRYNMTEHNRLPRIGEVCTPWDVMAVCRYFGWRDLERRISEQVEYLDDFKSDGCSRWPDSWGGNDYSRCCIAHDIEYWCGGTEDERFCADARLAICVCRIAGHEMAHIMFEGVRAGGGSAWRAPYSWGYGRGR